MQNVITVQQIRARILTYVAQYPGASAIEILGRAGINGENFKLDLPVMLEEMLNAGQLTQVVFISDQLPINHHPDIYFPVAGTLEIHKPNNDYINIMFDGKTVEVISASYKVEIIKR